MICLWPYLRRPAKIDYYWERMALSFMYELIQEAENNESTKGLAEIAKMEALDRVERRKRGEQDLWRYRDPQQGYPLHIVADRMFELLPPVG